MGWSVTDTIKNAAEYYAIAEHTNGIQLRVDVYTGSSPSSIFDPEDADEAIEDAIAALDAAANITALGVNKKYATFELYTP